MKNIIYLFLVILGITSCQNNQVDTDNQQTEKSPVEICCGTVERIENFESKYIAVRNVDVWLPDNYDENQQYNVLYMHDGQMLFDSTITWNGQEWGIDEIVSELIKNEQIEPTIIVGIWNIDKTRHADYFPQKPFESLDSNYQKELYEVNREANKKLFGRTKVQSDNYLKFLVEEVKPYIDSHYSTKAARENTFIAGSSMGGLISMYAICEYPEIFGAAACLSTHWTGIFTAENNPIPTAFANYMSEHLPDSETHKIYFDYGTETLDALYEPFQKQVDSVMISKGFTDKNWKTLKFEGKDHSENAWNERFHIPLEFIMN